MAEPAYNSIVVLQDGKYDFLVDHAVRNVWCNPEQDNQIILAPCRITAPEGALNYFDVMRRTMALPTRKEIYHVYQIGQAHPLVFGLFQVEPSWTAEQWIPISRSMNTRKMVADIYTEAGVQLPRFEVFYSFNNDRDLLIAIKEDKNLPIDYTADKIYLRVYSNAYFASLRANASVEGTFCAGSVITQRSQILDIQRLYESYATKEGLVYGFVNGLHVDRLDLFSIKVGDTVEFVYDSSVARSVTFTVKDLLTFTSTLDTRSKFLLHYNYAQNDTIDYQDDMDIFVLSEGIGGRYAGVYYHRNSRGACRMVTHRDYSIPVSFFTYFAEQLQSLRPDEVLDFQKLKIRLNIRKSGYHRPLVFENNRIKELYKLPDQNVLAVMAGIDATVPVWQAAALEHSAYTEIMRSGVTEVTTALVESAYGYNAVSKLLGDTPKLCYVSSGRKQVEVAHGLSVKSTAYEYNARGELLGFYAHNSGTVYNAVNGGAVLVEMLAGIGDYAPDVRFGTDNIPVPTADGYRVYRCHNTVNGPDNHWVDVTGTSVYTVVNNVLHWSPTDYNPYVMVRTDAKFLAYTLNMATVDGCLRFSFSELENRNGTPVNHILPVPMGELDLFLNGKTLIENVDYYVRFPEVVIVNKAFLKFPLAQLQEIHVRFKGFCNTDLTRDSYGDQGWVQYGLLSRNTKFDIRDDRVLRIVMNGSVYDRSQLVFSEEHVGLGILHSRNGYPYQIRDIVVPMKNHVTADTYAYREAAKVIDQAVSGYLTQKLPVAPETGPSAIHQRYEVFSPFISKLLYDITTDTLPLTTLATAETDNDILTLCQPYEHWLAFDPSQPEQQVDSNFVVIHPHNGYSAVALNAQQYSFIRRVVGLYCHGLVELSQFVVLA